MSITSPGEQITDAGLVGSRALTAWTSRVSDLLNGLTQSGTTANRPTANLYTGRMYLDTTLGKPIWYIDGTGWVDATGTGA